METTSRSPPRPNRRRISRPMLVEHAIRHITAVMDAQQEPPAGRVLNHRSPNDFMRIPVELRPRHKHHNRYPTPETATCLLHSRPPKTKDSHEWRLFDGRIYSSKRNKPQRLGSSDASLGRSDMMAVYLLDQ